MCLVVLIIFYIAHRYAQPIPCLKTLDFHILLYKKILYKKMSTTPERRKSDKIFFLTV
jgi:hypothetical protein